MLVRKSVVVGLSNYYITVNDDLEVHLYGLNDTTPVFNATNMRDANLAVDFFAEALQYPDKLEELMDADYPLTAENSFVTATYEGTYHGSLSYMNDSECGGLLI